MASERIKVGHLVSAFVAGGIERILRFVAEPMDALGFDSVLIALNDEIVPGPELEAVGTPTYGLSNHWKPIRFPVLPPRSLTRKLKGIQAAHGIQLIHAHHYAAIAAAPMVAKTMNVPYLVTNHAIDERWQSDPGLRMALLRRYMKTSFEGAQKILCWTQAVEDDVTRVCGHRMPQCQIVELPIDDRFFKLSEPNAVRDIDVIMVGRLAPQKNVLFAMEALAELKQRRPDVKVLVLGSGPLEADVHAKAKSLGLEGTVAFAGNVGPDEVLAALNRSKVQFMPSLFEGLSVAFIESLSLGLDAVVADIPSFRAPFKGEPGIHFAPNTDLGANAAALDDAIERYRYRDRSHFALRFGKGLYCERVSGIYRDILKK